MGRICREFKARMKNEVIEYIQACTRCTIVKPANHKLGLYLLVPIPNKHRHSISMDFMSGLPTTKHGHDCVSIAVDIFSKMEILVAYRKEISVEEISKIFFEHV